MKRPLTPLTLFLFLFTACTSSPDTPISSGTPMPPQTNNYAPSPEDNILTRGEVFLDSKSLATLESYPPQFMLQLQGNLPTPCHQLRIVVSPPDADNKVVVDVYSVVNPGEICIQVLAPFTVNYPLGSFPAGKYSLWVNGEMIAEFQAQ
ncbi:MAG: hypothetical protein OHK003_15400 [Anaerolineales bacterium]